jgi:hypothetical protein
MENQKSSSSLKAVVAVLAVLLVGLVLYFKMSSDADAVQTELKLQKLRRNCNERFRTVKSHL